MQLKDRLPSDALSLPTKDFLALIPGAWLGGMMQTLADYYNPRIPLWQAMRDQGVQVDGTEDEEQVECSFSEHGSNDAHKSARYFSYDRQTATKSERVYCYKCQKMTTAFWYVFKQRRDHHKESLKDVLAFIEYRFGVPLPKDYILAFDPEAFYTFSDSGDADQKTKGLFIKARQIRELRGDLPVYIESLQALLMTGEQSQPKTA